MRPKISVCIATHNGATFIIEQLKSILCQLDMGDEIIISDDGSKDLTLDIITQMNDPRIKIIHLSDNKKIKNKFASYYYASANFMNALSHSEGDYIFLSDQDDIWYENKIKECLTALRHCDIVSHNFSIIDERGLLIKYKYLENYDVTPWKVRLLLKTPYRGCCLAFRRNVLKTSLPYPKKLFLHDFWIGYNAAIKGYKYKYIDLPLIKYRRHNNNVSDLSSHNNLIFKISYRLTLLLQILHISLLNIFKR